MPPHMAASPTPPAASKSVVFFRRTASTLSLWAVVTAVFLSKVPLAYLALTGVLAVVASIEYFGMLRKAKADGFPRFGVAATLVYCAVLYAALLRDGDAPAWLDAAAIFAVTVGVFSLQLLRPIRGLASLTGVAVTVLGFIYIPYLFNFLTRVIFMDGGTADGKVSEQGALLLLWVLAVTKFTDTGAYLTGSLVGKHKMIPHISPAKTWEGFAGALAFAQIAGCGLYALFPEALAIFGHYGNVAALAFVLALLAVIGDLAESVVKRSLEAKDSGRFLPGIGGSLDLIDSVCFTAPAAFFYLKWILPHTT
jgi:phosphatidate cytidylyltransferase